VSDINLRLDEGALDRLLNQPSGEVGGHMRKIGLLIYAGAMAQAGSKTGDVRRRMYWTHGRRGRYQYVEVGSRSRHALMHHEGTKPHLIMPDSGRILRFNVGGRVVYARKVLHPGTRGNPFLTRPMRRAV
jgi:hypothetical protein